MPDDTVDPRLQKALDRYQVISSYVADPPPRGRRHLERQRLADRVWTDAQGEAFSVSAETIRAWVRAYHAKGLKGLMDEPRPSRGVSALSDEVIAKALVRQPKAIEWEEDTKVPATPNAGDEAVGGLTAH